MKQNRMLTLKEIFNSKYYKQMIYYNSFVFHFEINTTYDYLIILIPSKKFKKKNN